MAAQKKTTKKTTPSAQAAQPTAAMRLAALFDQGKDAFIADVQKPVEESTAKKIGACALVGGLAIGAWELAGF